MSTSNPTPTPLAGVASVPPPRSRRSPWPLIGLAVAFGVVVLGVGVAGALWLAVRVSAASRTGDEARVTPQIGLATIQKFENRHDSKGLAHDTAPAWEAASADFEEANKQPNAPVRWPAGEKFARGRAAYHRGNLEAAEAAFLLAADLDHSWALPHVGLAEVYGRRRDHEKCLAAAQRAQLLDPKLWLGVREAARAYLIKNDYTSAISEFRRALDLSPKNALLLSELALAYHGNHMDEEATRHAELALAQDSDLVSVHVLLAEQHLEANRGQKALDHASRAIAVQPTNVSGWLAKGDALVLLDRKDDATRAYREALRIQKETKSQAAPAQRLAEVERAIARGSLPAPRSARGVAVAARSASSPRGSGASPEPAITTKGDSPATGGPVAAAVAGEAQSEAPAQAKNPPEAKTRTESGEVDVPEPP